MVGGHIRQKRGEIQFGAGNALASGLGDHLEIVFRISLRCAGLEKAAFKDRLMCLAMTRVFPDRVR